MVSAALLLLLAFATVSLGAALKNQPKQSVSNCYNDKLTDAERKKFLDHHNTARLRLARGKQPNKSGFMNGAKNMYKLVGLLFGNEKQVRLGM
ncbi:hypothetical protein OESDEN_11687 [Oesophagostomum dentatum]|uniref:SCP domain-containing protein n=1 Tax=Oesophagostomum dentatum TaxID=61180 RepID=A0A0B1ST75_OESDE|nr:hypothetical protein OESDEN_11687 [Oesophagostomum dentatum]